MEGSSHKGGVSLRRRVTAWLAAILLVTMLSNGIATLAGRWSAKAFDTLLADNAACYTVQDALKDEIMPASERNAMPAHGAFCRAMRATGRSGTLFCSFRPRRIPTSSGCTG